MADAPALARLVGDPASFLEDRWGRRPWYAHRADSDGFADVLSLDDVDRIVAASGLRAPAFRLVREGHTLPTHQVTRRVRIGSRPVDDLIDVAAVHRQVADGATLVLQGLHRSWPPVVALCRDLELTLTHPVQANAYLTPPVATGLRLHGDPHDVFAVQTHGRKRWVVHPPDEEQPWELVLEPGDVLYLPAGTEHAAQSLEEPSLHLTIGVKVVTWRQIVHHVLEAALDDDRELTRSLPAGWAAEPEALEAELAEHLERVAGRLETGDALERTASGFWSRRVLDLSGGLRDLFELEAVGDTTWLRRRPGNLLRVEADGRRVLARLGDRTLAMPVAVAPVLERIGAAERLRPRDLDDLADEGSRLVICRRLVREGLLTIERDGMDSDDPAGTPRG